MGLYIEGLSMPVFSCDLLIRRNGGVPQAIQTERDGVEQIAVRPVYEITPTRPCLSGSRMYRLRTLPEKALAAYLAVELSDSLPVDWLAWLREEVPQS